MKSKNLALAIKWFIFLPILLPVCIIFGVINGTGTMLYNIAISMWADITQS